jgi:hypothetical protein
VHFEAIGNKLGDYIEADMSFEETGLMFVARILVKLDLRRKRRHKYIKTSTKQDNTVFTWFTPTSGLRPPNLLLYHPQSTGYKHRSIKTLLRIGQKICAAH